MTIQQQTTPQPIISAQYRDMTMTAPQNDRKSHRSDALSPPPRKTIQDNKQFEVRLQGIVRVRDTSTDATGDLKLAIFRENCQMLRP